MLQYCDPQQWASISSDHKRTFGLGKTLLAPLTLKVFDSYFLAIATNHSIQMCYCTYVIYIDLLFACSPHGGETMTGTLGLRRESWMESHIIIFA